MYLDISVQGSVPHYYNILLLGSKGGWRALAMNKYYNIMATQNTQMTDRKRIRTSPDFMTMNLDLFRFVHGHDFC